MSFRRLVDLADRAVAVDPISRREPLNFFSDFDHEAHYHVADRAFDRRPRFRLLLSGQEETQLRVPRLRGERTACQAVAFGAVLGRGERDVHAYVEGSLGRQLVFAETEAGSVGADDLAWHVGASGVRSEYGCRRMAVWEYGGGVAALYTHPPILPYCIAVETGATHCYGGADSSCVLGPAGAGA